MKVALITTGVMELLGLAAGLDRLFPGHQFVAIPRTVDMPGRPAAPFDGFTSDVVQLSHAQDTASNLRRLVTELAGCVYPGSAGYDLAVLLDDLELVNLRSAAVVVDAVKNAVQAHLSELAARDPGVAARTRTALRERASFHLASPMTESWFFGSPSGMTNNGVPVGRLPLLNAASDPEDFEVSDAAYSADDGQQCIQLAVRNRRRRENRRAPWQIPLRPGMPWVCREKHPKAYLQWLCRSPTENTCTAWQESQQGAEALGILSWSAVLWNPAWFGLLRAMIHDLSDGLGVPVPNAMTTSGPTALRAPAQRTALRNL